jgi:N-acetylglucosamine kinase-like BadF-type ATPase
MKRYYIGIDGGGTKTEFLLTDERENTIKRVIKSGSNPNDIGIVNSYMVLSNGISELLSGMEIAPNALHVFAGVSGAGVGDNAATLCAKLTEKYPNVRVKSDLWNGLELCLGGQDGIAVICGTGVSCCVYRDGEVQIVGGYGYLFEEGGSGYAYGRDLIKYALQAEDGIFPRSPIVQKLCEKFSVSSVRAALGSLLRGGKSSIAELCPMTFEGYNDGDAICQRVVRENLSHTETLIQQAIEVTNGHALPISFIGGVTTNKVFRSYMGGVFAKKTLIFTDEKPVMGAVRLAKKGDE